MRGSRSSRVGLYGLAPYIIVSVSALAQAVVYQSASAALVCLIALLVLHAFRFIPGGHKEHFYIVSWVYAIGTVAGLVAAVYAEHLGDPGQLYQDAAWFYNLSSSGGDGLTMDELRVRTEGSAAVALWRIFYEISSMAGLERGRFVGVTVNATCVALSAGVLGRLVLTIHPGDVWRIRRLTRLFAGCGLIWLYSGIHLRDAQVLLLGVMLFYLNARMLARFSFEAFFLCALSTVAATYVFGYLRSEFEFAPPIMFFVALGLLITSGSGISAHARSFMLVTALIVGGPALVTLTPGLIDITISGHVSYVDHSVNASAADSLGAKYMVSLPAPMRAVVGPAYMLLMPIPFWQGFLAGSAYHFFKSLNVLFFYALIPLLILSLRQLVASRFRDMPVQIYSLILLVGFLMAISITSMENRHLAIVIAPLFYLCVQPDLRDLRNRKRFVLLFLSMLMLMWLAHTIWALLKYAVGPA